MNPSGLLFSAAIIYLCLFAANTTRRLRRNARMNLVPGPHRSGITRRFLHRLKPRWLTQQRFRKFVLGVTVLIGLLLKETLGWQFGPPEVFAPWLLGFALAARYLRNRPVSPELYASEFFLREATAAWIALTIFLLVTCPALLVFGGCTVWIFETDHVIDLLNAMFD